MATKRKHTTYKKFSRSNDKKRRIVSHSHDFNYDNELMDLWQSCGDCGDENVYPPFDIDGNLIPSDELKENEDYDNVLKRYTSAFIKWVNELKQRLCKNLLLILKAEKSFSSDIMDLSLKDEGKIFSLYMDLCRISQNSANISRELLFPDFRKLLFAQESTLKNISKNLINWGTEYNESKSRERIANFDFSADFSITRLKSDAHNYSVNGILLHQNYAPYIVQDFLTLHRLQNLDCFIPGRLVSAKLPFIASTPDICVAPSQELFGEVYGQYLQNHSIEENLKPYLPQFWAEVKTIHTKPSLIEKEELKTLYQYTAHLHRLQVRTNIIKLTQSSMSLSQMLGISGWEDVFYDSNITWLEEETRIQCKLEAKKLLIKKLSDAKWLSSKRDFLQRNSIMMMKTNKHDDKFTSLNKLKYLCSQNNNKNPIVPVLPLIQAGQAWIFLYDRTKEGHDKLLLQSWFETAPLILGPNSAHYVQIVQQFCCVRHLNDEAVYLFILILKHTPGQNMDPRDNNYYNHPSLVYLYEVIIPECVCVQFEKQCFYQATEKFGFDTKLREAGESFIHSIMENLFENLKL